MQKSARQDFPTVAQIRQLRVQYTTVVPPDWEDRNGHVNVQFYLTLYEQGGYEILNEVGVDDAYLTAHRFGLFDLEHHLHYRSEMLVGDQVSTYNRIMHRNDKRFHGMYFIVNNRQKKLACTLEYVTAGVSLQTRRTAPFPERMRLGLDLQIEKQRRLKWTAPLCGAMGV
jgi:acyl-CoA thioester hydrolase